MDYISNLQIQVASMKQGLFDQGYLDEQFIQIEMLQDETSPNFVEDVLMLFLRDSTKLVNDIEQTLIGAHRVNNECWRLREFCEECNVERCFESFRILKREHAIFKEKLECYLKLVRQAKHAEATSPPK
ncbi:Histidine-containing phosphotransfer protein 4 [Acorus gramineus]|uniref:Histidine-containing phosphotransfer protein n=1 Tax=Acorus gramineus TaxID=55184 RepID=A0AAV9BLP4_ACOGR|nr:Histidine-containing phosphotransfer protein 4 [Acorus gramineus]